MNTTKKGDLFEERGYEIITDAINKGQLGIIETQCKVFKKKGYFSKDRGSNIIFDLTIEVWPPESERFVLLYIVECKNYSSKIPVDDVEEFYAKIIQVSGVNVKGVFIANNKFQKGAFKYASSKGIMLIEDNRDRIYNIILHKANRSNIEDKNREFIFVEDNATINDTIRRIDNLLENLFTSSSKRKKEDGLKILSKKEIGKITRDIIDYFDPSIISHIRFTPIEKIFNLFEVKFELILSAEESLGKDIDGRELIASCDLKERVIRIHKSVQGTSRYPFILAHELGHFYLHYDLGISQKEYELFTDSEFSFRLGRYELKNKRNWIEWQANQFASSLLMPEDSIFSSMYSFQRGIGISKASKMYIDNQPVNIKDFRLTIAHLASVFRVTKTNVIYRLNDLELIEYDERIRTIGQIIMSYGK